MLYGSVWGCMVCVGLGVRVMMNGHDLCCMGVYVYI